MADVSGLAKALEEAQRVARLPVQDRLAGRTGAEAGDAVFHILLETGLTVTDADRLVSAIAWAGWNEGWQQSQAETKEDRS